MAPSSQVLEPPGIPGRFTLRTEWAYATAWTGNDERTAALDSWLEHYNTARSHSALGGRPPISRLTA